MIVNSTLGYTLIPIEFKRSLKLPHLIYPIQLLSPQIGILKMLLHPTMRHQVDSVRMDGLAFQKIGKRHFFQYNQNSFE